MLWGAEPPERIAVDEHGMTLLVDVRRGQKTGHFLDQRENRRMVRDAGPRARRGASTCSATPAGFSVAAALGGARHVVTVDVDRDAIALARENFRANGLDPADHAFAAEDCFELLARYRKEGRRFDLVVCDPPAFAKSQKAVEGALAGYASLNRAALAVLVAGRAARHRQLLAPASRPSSSRTRSRRRPSRPAWTSRWWRRRASRPTTRSRSSSGRGGTSSAWCCGARAEWSSAGRGRSPRADQPQIASPGPGGRSSPQPSIVLSRSSCSFPCWRASRSVSSSSQRELGSDRSSDW